VDAIKMASATPAKIIGVYQTIGSLDIGKRADVVLLDDQLNVKMTIKDGKVIYNAENR
jgi:N-acetylglucosamine-6-phosphate deacetylase